MQRTIDSATSQLQGLFDVALTFPEPDAAYAINVVDSADDFLLHVKDNCPRFKSIQSFASAYPTVVAMHEQVDADNEEDFFPRLRTMTGMVDATTDDLNDVCNYLYWAIVNDLDLTFGEELTAEDRDRINVGEHLDLYEGQESHWELVAFPSYELFSQFSEFIDIVEQNARWEDQPFFTKYYKPSEHSTFPKFIFYSAHAETLGPLTVALEKAIATERAPGSAIFVEFY